MLKKSASYTGMSWVKALAARDKPRDPSVDLANIPEEELIKGDTLEATAALAFNTPKTETKHDALMRASKDLYDKYEIDLKTHAIASVKEKIATNAIDPVALKIVTKEQWDAVADVDSAQKIATAAAIEYERRLRHEFECNASRPQQILSSKFEHTFKGGRIMSSTSENEDTVGSSGRTPANSNSIFDPDRIGKYAREKNLHDSAINTLRKEIVARNEQKKAELAPKETGIEPMKAGQIIASASGNENGDAFVHRVPSNQVSMLDTMHEGKLDREQITSKLNTLFMSKFEQDSGTQIKEAAKQHKADIQVERKKDKSWEKLEKPKTVGDLQERLLNLWTMPEKE